MQKNDLSSKKYNFDNLDEDSFIDLMGFSGFGKIREKTKSYNRLIESTKTNLVEKKVPSHEENKIEQDDEGNDEKDDKKTKITQNYSSDDEDEIDDNVIEFSSKNPENKIPLTNMLEFAPAKKLVSVITIDNSGSRMVVAGHDFNYNMYDFATTDGSFKPFRVFRPLEDMPIRGVKYSPANDLVMVYGGSSLVKLVNKDGKTMCDCNRGDRYIVDYCQTNGHVSAVNAGSWNPIDLDTFVTAGEDQTIRIWSVEIADLGNKRVMKLKNPRNPFNPCVELIYDQNGVVMYGSRLDGSLNIWDPRKPTAVPATCVQNAHQNGSPAYSIITSRNQNNLVSRGYDGTLKLWDLRSFKEPVKEIELPNCFDTLRAVYSPDYRIIMTGTSKNRGKEDCAFNFYDAENLELLRKIPFENSTPLVSLWHPKLNQLFVGFSDGKVRVFFDPVKSQKGVLLCMTKIHETKIDEGEELLHTHVFTPYTQQDGVELTNVNVRKLQIKARRDPFQTKKPEPPVYGPGQGGRLTTAMSLSAFVCHQLFPSVPISEEGNPRENILKYAKLAEDEPYYVAPAYKKTQPKPIYRDPALDEDDSDDILKKKKTK